MKTQDQLRHPIGTWNRQEHYSQAQLDELLITLRVMPDKLKALTTQISEAESQLCYREGGWNVQEVVNHLVDSHINSYIRMKLALTEDTPVIKPYNENTWAKTSDYKLISTTDAVVTLHQIHQRMIALFDKATTQDWNRTFYHPGRKEKLTLSENISLYAWHSLHHLEHVRIALSAKL